MAGTLDFWAQLAAPQSTHNLTVIEEKEIKNPVPIAASASSVLQDQQVFGFAESAQPDGTTIRTVNVAARSEMSPEELRFRDAFPTQYEFARSKIVARVASKTEKLMQAKLARQIELFTVQTSPLSTSTSASQRTIG